mgnify:CR=1 FL=1
MISVPVNASGYPCKCNGACNYSKAYEEAGIDAKFVQDDVSISRRHVLRGIHGDSETCKLVTCLEGSFYLVVVNNDSRHAQFKKWEAFNLSETNRLQVYIPPKFGNGHIVMSDRAIFHYKQNSNYDRKSQFTIKWNDPSLNFWWPINNPITSIRDEG